MMTLQEFDDTLKIIGSVLGSGGILYTVYRIIKKYIFAPFADHFNKMNKGVESICALDAKINKEVLPFIKSLKDEFSENSGKSIKDQLSRIDDTVRLAELRSKLIASSFTNIGMYECDPQGKCVWANAAMCDIFGLTLEEVLGNGWLGGILDSEREAVLDRWMTSVHNDIPYDNTYHVVNRRTHETYLIKTTAIVNKSRDGKILGYHGQIIKS